MRDGKIDMVELDKMVEYAMAHGANYFDTAYMYVDGKSENAIGEILKKYPRESFILTDKNPAYLVNSPEDVHKLFNEQLKKCQVEYFDNYMVHNINKNTLSNYRDNDMYGELLKLKKQGKIKHLGFSFHGDPAMLREVIKEHDWDFCQLQINYLDWEVVNADELYQIADEAGVPVIVMEPLRGGVLCDLPQKAADKLKAECPEDTQASFGLRWVANKPRVFTILSGMSNLQQLKENIDTFVNYREFTEREDKVAHEIAQIIQSQGAISCTACKYCMEVCPRGINIPGIFGLYNMYKGSTAANAAFILYKKKNKVRKNFPVKYFIAAIAFGVLAGGSVVILRYIEPYTYFGSLMTGSLLGIAAFVVTLMIVFFKNRYFCTNICPVGAILGLLSKFSFNKIYIADGCVSCGQCERNCPSGCINSKEKTVDNETCVKCLKCLDVCPKKTIKFGRKAVKFNPKRRDFVVGAAALAVFGAFVKAGIVIKDKVASKFKDIILPPGAVKDEDIINRCFNCNLCVANCPNKGLCRESGFVRRNEF